MTRSSSVVIVLVTVALLTSGCTAPAEPAVPAAPTAAASAGPDGGSQALPPTIVSPGQLEGTDVAVVIGTALVIAVDDGTEDQWHGTTADVTIAEFSAGGSDEGATFRPGFIARKIGTTAATLTAPDGTVRAFTIAVVAP
ncbi:MAG: hypothetical protein BGO45_10350 [Microbacterium sp. 71-36]|uniref:hypothetical protein n=1 Tax=unclassified Microbacterium TaxID=2609290 RepID=UPI00086B650A|nr:MULTISPECIES: hypothetical protein [unclassified Microbacterium]MBN9210921.1 hypothetical protein [Microbacterium sp.]ODT38846.1 MAG: hypothetical protein ABS60_09155 [Microbacterium sp. SCN 71-17]OJV77194.1 MAG: hypothetical protein BGO45_10350 [Microbacterium sp. 71-36]